MTKNQVARELKDKGFGVREYSNGVFVYLRTRNVGQLEITMALIDSKENFKMRRANDPHRYNREGVLITVS